jgi:uncharacterized protein (TIGR02246 family)
VKSQAGGSVLEEDERTIRSLMARWHQATAAGAVEAVGGLMADDALFLVSGRAPFGKDEFKKTSRSLQGTRIESSSAIEELELADDWAWIRNRVTVTMTPPGGQPHRRSGQTLSILRKQADGRWVVARDANLLAGSSLAEPRGKRPPAAPLSRCRALSS